MSEDLIRVFIKGDKQMLLEKNYDDFLAMAVKSFDLEEMDNYLGKFPELTKYQKDCLKFRFRYVPDIFFEKYCRSVLPVNETPKTPLHEILLAQRPAMRSATLNDLIYECQKHEKETKKIIEQLSTSLAKQGKYDRFFLDFFRRENAKTHKGKIKNFYEKLKNAGKIDVSYEAFRKAYLRWKNAEKGLTQNINWPSKDFIRFYAFISVHYKFIGEHLLLSMNDRTDPYLQFMWNMCVCIPNSRKEQSDKTRFELQKNKREPEKTKIYKKLARQNNINAIKYLLSGVDISEEERKTLKLHYAIIVPESNEAKERAWREDYCWEGVSIEPCNKFKNLQSRNIILCANNTWVQPKTLISEITFPVDINHDQWLENAWSKEQKTTYSNACYCMNYKYTCSVKNPSSVDFDNIMKLGNAIKNLTFVFKGGGEITVLPKLPTYTPNAPTDLQRKLERLKELIVKAILRGSQIQPPNIIEAQCDTLITSLESAI